LVGKLSQLCNAVREQRLNNLLTEDELYKLLVGGPYNLNCGVGKKNKLLEALTKAKTFFTQQGYQKFQEGNQEEDFTLTEKYHACLYAAKELFSKKEQLFEKWWHWSTTTLQNSEISPPGTAALMSRVGRIPLEACENHVIAYNALLKNSIAACKNFDQTWDGLYKKQEQYGSFSVAEELIYDLNGLWGKALASAEANKSWSLSNLASSAVAVLATTTTSKRATYEGLNNDKGIVNWHTEFKKVADSYSSRGFYEGTLKEGFINWSEVFKTHAPVVQEQAQAADKDKAAAVPVASTTEAQPQAVSPLAAPAKS